MEIGWLFFSTVKPVNNGNCDSQFLNSGISVNSEKTFSRVIPLLLTGFTVILLLNVDEWNMNYCISYHKLIS